MRVNNNGRKNPPPLNCGWRCSGSDDGDACRWGPGGVQLLIHRCGGVCAPSRPMVGGTRETVRWDQGDTPFPNVGPQQQPQPTTTSGTSPSNNNHSGGIIDGGRRDVVVLGDALSFEDNDEGTDEEDGRRTGSGTIGGAGAGVRSGSTDVSKEVRYAPSPTQSNPTATSGDPQLPLQRAHSRF